MQNEDGWRVFDTVNDRKRNRKDHARAVKQDPKYLPHFSQNPVPADPTPSIFVRGPHDDAVSLQSHFAARLEVVRRNSPCAPSASREIQRTNVMARLREFYASLRAAAHIPVPVGKGLKESFTRWMFERKAAEQAIVGLDVALKEPVIPMAPVEVSSGMLRELEDDAKGITDPIERRRVCSEICLSLAQRSHDEALALHQQWTSESCDSQGPSNSVQVMHFKDVVRLTHAGITHEILLSHFKKLETLFNGYNSHCKESEVFALRLFSMLQRYRTLNGTDAPSDGSGHHCATPPAVLEGMHELFGVEMECFGSPYNSHFGHYGSMFEDTDMFFGSMGSFFAFNPVEGSFEVGPPFVEELMEQMRVHLETLMSSSERPLSFLVMVPRWEHPMTPCIQRIRENKSGFLRRIIVLPQNEHIFLDGFQHCLRVLPFRPVHDTLTFVLQNDAGAAKWPADDARTARLLEVHKKTTDGVPENPLFRTNHSVPLKRDREVA